MSPKPKAIVELIDLAVEHTLQERCSAAEAAKIRLAFAYPSPEVEDLVQDSVALVIEALEMGIPPMLNAVLFPED